MIKFLGIILTLPLLVAVSHSKAEITEEDLSMKCDESDAPCLVKLVQMQDELIAKSSQAMQLSNRMMEEAMGVLRSHAAEKKCIAKNLSSYIGARKSPTYEDFMSILSECESNYKREPRL